MSNTFANTLLSYVKEDNQKYLNLNAFNEIANVFYGFLQQQVHEEFNLKRGWVCNAAPGHGKTTVLISVGKYLTDERRPDKQIPLLLAFKNIDLMESVYEELKIHNEECAVMVQAENINEVTEYIKHYQIVLITHQRLQDLALGFGDKTLFSDWVKPKYYRKETKSFEGVILKRERLLISDEKLPFVNSASFNLTSGNNNAVDWISLLAPALNLNAYETQTLISHVAFLIGKQLRTNMTTVTKSLLDEDEKKLEGTIYLVDTLKRMEETNRMNIEGRESLLKLRVFRRLLTEYGVGRIDEYKERNQTGRKIIAAEHIDYPEVLGLNTLILDGTAHVTKSQYAGYVFKEVTNYNDYSRLTLSQRIINTSKQSRQKEGHPIQTDISHDISELRKTGFQDLFVLPMKSDITVYLGDGAIINNHREFFEKTKDEDTNPVNLLNVTGKNFLRDTTAIYLTSLPRFHADFYKAIAISVYGHNVALTTDKTKGRWFDDERLEQIYRECLYAELLQIIHRGKIRNVTGPDKVHVFIACNDSDLLSALNANYLKDQANIESTPIQDKYGIGEKAKEFAEQVKYWHRINELEYGWQPITVNFPCKISDIDKSRGGNGVGSRLREFLKKHWGSDTKKHLIQRAINECGYEIYEANNKQKTKMIRLLKNE